MHVLPAFIPDVCISEALFTNVLTPAPQGLTSTFGSAKDHEWKQPMETTSTLFLGVLFGSIGLGFFVYGKKQKAVIPLISGIGLMVFPYFISNIYILIISGIALIVLPYFIKI